MLRLRDTIYGYLFFSQKKNQLPRGYFHQTDATYFALDISRMVVSSFNDVFPSVCVCAYPQTLENNPKFNSQNRCFNHQKYQNQSYNHTS